MNVVVVCSVVFLSKCTEPNDYSYLICHLSLSIAWIWWKWDPFYGLKRILWKLRLPCNALDFKLDCFYISTTTIIQNIMSFFGWFGLHFRSSLLGMLSLFINSPIFHHILWHIQISLFLLQFFSSCGALLLPAHKISK